MGANSGGMDRGGEGKEQRGGPVAAPGQSVLHVSVHVVSVQAVVVAGGGWSAPHLSPPALLSV